MRICPMHAVVPDASTDSDVPQPKGLLRGLFGGPSSQGWTVDVAKCSGCLLCAQYCPHGAVEPRERTLA